MTTVDLTIPAGESVSNSVALNGARVTALSVSEASITPSGRPPMYVFEAFIDGVWVAFGHDLLFSDLSDNIDSLRVFPDDTSLVVLTDPIWSQMPDVVRVRWAPEVAPPSDAIPHTMTLTIDPPREIEVVIPYVAGPTTGSSVGISDAIFIDGARVSRMIIGADGGVEFAFETFVDGAWVPITQRRGIDNTDIPLVFHPQGELPKQYVLSHPLWSAMPSTFRLRLTGQGMVPAGEEVRIKFLLSYLPAVVVHEVVSDLATVLAAVSTLAANTAAFAAADADRSAAGVATILAAINALSATLAAEGVTDAAHLATVLAAIETAKAAIIAAIPGHH